MQRIALSIFYAGPQEVIQKGEQTPSIYILDGYGRENLILFCLRDYHHLQTTHISGFTKGNFIVAQKLWKTD